MRDLEEALAKHEQAQRMDGTQDAKVTARLQAGDAMARAIREHIRRTRAGQR